MPRQFDITIQTLEEASSSPTKLRWTDFEQAFNGLLIEALPGSEGTHWVLNHRSASTNFYSVLWGGRTDSSLEEKKRHGVIERAQFDLNLSDESDPLCHPIWHGLATLVIHHDIYLTIEPYTAGWLDARGIIASSADKFAKLPSWETDRDLQFFCESESDVLTVFADAATLLKEFNGNREPRLSWADMIDRDISAIESFKTYVTGKGRSRKSLTWGKFKLKGRSKGPDFAAVYGCTIDWREAHTDIVYMFSQCLKDPQQLGVIELDEQLQLSYLNKTMYVSFEEIGRERYVTLRALNTLLSGEFEIRALAKERDGDTHTFAIAPCWLWNQLETEHKELLDRKFRIVSLADGFVSGRRK
jgi:hypothetical protein